MYFSHASLAIAYWGNNVNSKDLYQKNVLHNVHTFKVFPQYVFFHALLNG